MHPIARFLQVVLLLAGFALLGTGWVMTDDAKGQVELRYEWICRPDAGSTNQQRCESAGPRNYSFINDDVPENGLSVSLAGVGLIVASASVAAGARRAPAPAPAQQASGYAPPTPPYTPPGQGY